jgi:hypothetical protein
MKTTKRIILLFLVLFISFFSNNTFAQEVSNTTPKKNKKSYDCTFMEVALGTRMFGEVPTDIFAEIGSFKENVDFGGGRPLTASLGLVMLPDEKGLSASFGIEGYLGSTYGIGIKMGVGYKFGNERFTFSPMFEIGGGRMFGHITSIKLDSSSVFAFMLDGESEAIYLGSRVKVNDGYGSNISVQVSSAFFELKPSMYLAFKVNDKFSIFSRFGYNILIGKSKMDLTASGKGYDNLDQLTTTDQPPHTIITEFGNDRNFMTDGNGDVVEKHPVNFTGMQFQIGVGFHTGT